MRAIRFLLLAVIGILVSHDGSTAAGNQPEDASLGTHRPAEVRALADGSTTLLAANLRAGRSAGSQSAHQQRTGRGGAETPVDDDDLDVHKEDIPGLDLPERRAAEVMVPRGSIVMWSGSIDEDGHPLVGLTPDTRWRICDGNDGTPDLRDRFIVGAGEVYFTGDTGGSGEVSLTTDQLPSHGHAYAGETNTTGRHTHYYSDGFWDTEQSVTTGAWKAANDDFYLWEGLTGGAGEHAHTFSGTTASVGGGEAHENRPPYYALAFIMHVGD